MENNTIGCQFEWDRKVPLPEGREFYCSPLIISFYIVDREKTNVKYIMDNLGFKGSDDDDGGATFRKEFRTSEAVLKSIDSFMSSYLASNTVQGIGTPESPSWEFEQYFLERLMYWQQSVNRYSIRTDSGS